MQYPKRIRNQPIVDAICEIRFEPKLPVDITAGLIVDKLNLGDSVNIEKLPIQNFPDQIRNKDQNLKYLPSYRAKLDDFILQFGGRVISLSSPTPYCGWQKFSTQINDSLVKVLQNYFIDSVSRIGYRIVNYFDKDVLGLSKFKVTDILPFEKTQYSHTEVFRDGEYTIRVVHANAATLKLQENIRQGSILDIDVFVEGAIEKSVEIIKEKIFKIHELEKQVFFDTLKTEVIADLDPEYE